MSEAIIKKNGTDYPLLTMPNHYPADRVYLDGDTTKTVQDKCARKADLTNLDLTGTTNTTGSTIASGTYFYLNGVLVRAKTAIANGATFTLNTNYEVMTVGDALDALKIKTKTVTGTTSSSGGLNLGLTYPDNIVLYVVESGGGYPIMLGAYQSSWMAVVTNNSTSGDITPVRNKQVTLNVAYI